MEILSLDFHKISLLKVYLYVFANGCKTTSTQFGVTELHTIDNCYDNSVHGELLKDTRVAKNACLLNVCKISIDYRRQEKSSAQQKNFNYIVTYTNLELNIHLVVNMCSFCKEKQ
jgi:hypothetical protein